MKALRRLSIGPFHIEDALNLDKIGVDSVEKALNAKIIPLRDAIPHLKEVQVDEELAKKIRNGYQPQWEVLMGSAPLPAVFENEVKLVNDRTLVAIMKVPRQKEHDGVGLEILRVFH